MEPSELISKEQQDILKELANIGVGNALTALSTMLDGQRVDMNVPEVMVVPLQDAPESFGNPESLVAATFCEADSAVMGLVLVLVLPFDDAKKIIGKMMPENVADTDEMGKSILMELGNIITGSYLSALSFMTQITFQATPPRLGIDMAGAVMGTVIAETKTVEDNIILLKTELSIENKYIEGSVLILPDSGSLTTLFEHLVNL